MDSRHGLLNIFAYVRNVVCPLACGSCHFPYRLIRPQMVFHTVRIRFRLGMVHLQMVFQKRRCLGEPVGFIALYPPDSHDSRRQTRALHLLPAGLLFRKLARLSGDIHAVERRTRKPWGNHCPFLCNALVRTSLRQEKPFRLRMVA